MTTYLGVDAALEAKYPFAAIPVPDGDGWEIVFPDIPGVVGFAETWDAIGAAAKTILAEWLELEDEDGHPLPSPTIDWNPIERSHGSHEVPELYSTEHVAQELGVTKRRVVALAKSREVGQKVGNALAFTRQDIEAMQHRAPGRPRNASTAIGS